MIVKLHGHLGDNVSALVDGQLSPADEERAWAHVHGCPGCRALVAREGWVKQQMLGLSGRADMPSRLVDQLAHLPAADSWAQVHALEASSRRRRTTVVMAGAGSVGAAALALVALTGAPAGNGRPPIDRAPASVNPAATPSASPGRVGSGVARVAYEAAFGPAGLPAGRTATPAAAPAGAAR